MNTKELFDLAGIYHTRARGLFDPEDYDVREWDDLTPAQQAAKAEGIRAVVEELVNRGWGYYPQRFVLGVPENDLGYWEITEGFANPKGVSLPTPVVTDDMLQFPSTPNLVQAINDANLTAYEMAQVTAVPKPQVWDRIEDVPAFVVVTDRDHDFWKIDDDGDTFLKCSDENGFRRINDSYEEINYFKPFTEVIEPDTWDRWEDVPEGVKYSGVNDDTKPAEVYENRSGVRWNITDGNDFESIYSDETMETIAPFKRVG